MSQRRSPSGSASRRGVVAAALGAIVMSIGMVGAGASATVPPRISGLVSVGSIAPGGAQISAVSCATETDCVAVGLTSNFVGGAATSNDGGLTWTPLHEVGYPFVSDLRGVFCSSTTTCVAVGGGTSSEAVAVIATLSGGTWQWSKPVSIVAATNPTSEFIDMYAVNCVSATACLATGLDDTARDAVMSYTNNGGLTWSPATVVPDDGVVGTVGTAQFNALDCPSLTSCVLVGSDKKGGGMATTATLFNNVWTVAPQAHAIADVGLNTGQLLGVSCPTSTSCVAIGHDSSGHSVVALGSLFLNSWGWSNESDIATDATGIGRLTAIRCEAAVDCVAVGEDSNGLISTTTSNTGSTWSAEKPIASSTPSDSVSAVTCVSPTDCFAMGSVGLTIYHESVLTTSTTNFGASWSAPSTVPTSGVPSWALLSRVDCSSATHCVAIGGNSNVQSYVTTSNNAGATWSNESVMPQASSGVSNYFALGCPSAKTCVAVGATTTGLGAAARSTDGGRTWSQPVTLTPDALGTGTLDAISCPTSRRCVAIGNDKNDNKVVAISTDAGTTWSAENELPTSGFSNGDFHSISCVGALECTAVGSDATGAATFFSRDGGVSWREAHSANGAYSLEGVSCPSATRCVAVGEDQSEEPIVLTSSNGGATWIAHHPNAAPSGGGYFDSVSCSLPANCVATGVGRDDGGIIAYSTNEGVSWSPARAYTSLGTNLFYFASVNCSSATRCAAVGTGPGYIGATTTIHFAASAHFVGAGGRGSMRAQSAFSATRLSANRFTRTGYHFAGWATSRHGRVRYANSARYSFDADVTLYAVWQRAG